MKGQEKLQHIVKHMGGGRGGGNKQGLEGSMWRKKKIRENHTFLLD